MEPHDVAELARVLRTDYSPTALDPRVDEPAVVEDPDGFRRLLRPRHEQPEPWRSFRLVDAAGLGATLVVTFTWDDGADDDTVFVLPVDACEIDVDPGDDVAVTTFLNRLLEFTLGGDRSTWEPARTTPLGPRLAVVRAWTT